MDQQCERKTSIRHGWPSGLRRQFKVLFSSGAWVRTPLHAFLAQEDVYRNENVFTLFYFNLFCFSLFYFFFLFFLSFPLLLFISFSFFPSSLFIYFSFPLLFFVLFILFPFPFLFYLFFIFSFFSIYLFYTSCTSRIDCSLHWQVHIKQDTPVPIRTRK